MNPLGDRILDELRSVLPAELRDRLPPPVLREMEMAFEAYEPGRSLTASFPLFPRYAGPAGMTQGGVIATAFDNAYGPLAFLTAGSFAVTLSLDLSFVRPLPVDAGRFTVEVEMIESTRRVIFLEGRARNPEGKLVATSTTEMIVVDDGSLGG